MSASRLLAWSLLALAPVLAAGARATPALASTELPVFDHLRPANNPYDDGPVGYDEVLGRLLLGGLGASVELQVVTLPWRGSEEVVAIRAEGKGFVVQHVKLAESLSRAVDRERQRLREKNVHSPKEIAAALAAVSVGVRRTAAPIDGALAAALKAVWNDMIGDAANPRPSRLRVLDGETFQVAGRTAGGRYRWATTHSPPGNSRCGRLIGIAQALARYADADAGTRPNIAREIAAETAALRAALIEPRREEIDDQTSEE